LKEKNLVHNANWGLTLSICLFFRYAYKRYAVCLWKKHTCMAKFWQN